MYWDPPVMTFTGRQKYWNIFDLVTVLVGLAVKLLNVVRKGASFSFVYENRQALSARLVKAHGSATEHHHSIVMARYAFSDLRWF